MRLASSLFDGVLRSSRALCIGVALLSLVDAASADRLLRRDGQPALDGRALEVDDNGVLFRVARGAEQSDLLVTWDQIRLFETDREGFAERSAERREMSEQLWRARSRVERLDYAAAEPIFESLFAQTLNRTDATAITVAEGLLRCRLARGARAAAVVPWLELHRLLAQGLKPTAYLALPPVVDAQTGICPQLPPIWTRSAGVEQLLADLAQYIPDATATERLASLYTRAARLTLGVRVQDPALFYNMDESWQRDPAALMVTAMVAANEEITPFPIEVDRTFARLYREPGLLSPWAWFVRGRARAAVKDAQVQRQGLVDLLTIPALHDETHPYLAGFAIDAAARVLDTLGRSDAAASLRTELRRDYPTHPLNDAAATARIASSEKKP